MSCIDEPAAVGAVVGAGRPNTCVSFEGKLIKRLCGQAFLFASLEPGWEKTIFWFESKDMDKDHVKEVIRSLQFDRVYRFRDVVDFTPWVQTGISVITLVVVDLVCV